MEHFNVTFRPEGRQVSIHANATIAEAAGQAGIILNSVCGGRGICKKCAVILEPSGREVLACQYNIQSDITVTIPRDSRFFEQKILAHGIDIKNKIQPPVSAETYEPAHRIYGVAIDIGTTTVVAKLLDMADGKHLATQAAVNPQIKYGDDCVSRIAYAKTDEKLAVLHKMIIDCLNQLIEKLCTQASINPNHIHWLSVVGNTTMNHIFLKFPVTSLGQAPYDAFSLDAHDLPAEKLSLKVNPAANVHTAENIAGFVGSDITAVALATDVLEVKEMTLIVDIGTNGEIVLGTADKLYAASCAAGPAFEGARISCGSRAVEGAIEAVVLTDGDIALDVIGGVAPRSICGSGLIDAVAVLLDLGVIDNTGRFVERQKLPSELTPAVLSKLTEKNGMPAFCLADNTNSNEPNVFLTQKDIRETQLAKAAIRTGIKLLMKKIAIKDDGIRHILLAGAFGNYIRRESALRIGLLPNVPSERIVFVGNAACSGAQMLLLSQKARNLAAELARKIKYVEIANEPEFNDVFAESMLF